MDKLRRIHPATMAEERAMEKRRGRQKRPDDGPICWIMLIPTTREIMEQFLNGAIGERELLDRTPPGIAYESLYLCSALTLPEHRGKGLARRVALNAIASIRKDHPIKELFCWAFSPEGEKLASSLAETLGLPLFLKKKKA